MKKLLYSIHIPWGWIKQRPHFIAEELNDKFDVTVLEKKIQLPGAESKLPTKKSEKLKYKRFNSVPLYNPLKKRNILLDLINKIFIKSSVKFRNYDYIWITSIKYYAILKDFISDNHVVVYDCMDDELAFPSIATDEILANNAAIYEAELVNRANFIVCSSENLKQVILKRTGINKDILVVNNATIYPEYGSNFSKANVSFNRNTKSIVYIGTVAKWFDFGAIIKMLDENMEAELYLFGPVDCEIPQHERINVMGACEHKEIWPIMLQSDILIMPFQINPLILSVNPVKLYEYIWSRKPVISVEYPESLKFSDYVYYYSDRESLDAIYKDIKNKDFKPKCQDGEKIKVFLQNNSWKSRVAAIVKHIC